VKRICCSTDRISDRPLISSCWIEALDQRWTRPRINTSQTKRLQSFDRRFTLSHYRPGDVSRRGWRGASLLSRLWQVLSLDVGGDYCKRARIPRFLGDISARIGLSLNTQCAYRDIPLGGVVLSCVLECSRSSELIHPPVHGSCWRFGHGRRLPVTPLETEFIGSCGREFVTERHCHTLKLQQRDIGSLDYLNHAVALHPAPNQPRN